MNMLAGSARTDAKLANTATDINQTGNSMGQLRTTNKRHKRAIIKAQARRSVPNAPAVVRKIDKAGR